MTDTADFGRLSRNWIYWSQPTRLANPSVSTDCDDCQILFSSTEYSVHLRNDGTWWSVDTVGERGDRSNDTAQFSDYALAEKYLIWIWGSAARSMLRKPILGQQFYAKGFDPGVERLQLSEGVYELRSPEGRAVLAEPYATIFSHLMQKSEEDVEQMLRADL